MRISWIGAVALAACTGGGGGDEGAGSSEAGGGTTAGSTSAGGTTTGATSEPTTSGPGPETSGTTGSTPGTSSSATSGSDSTGPDPTAGGLGCPLDEDDDVAALMLAPVLFADGGDPTGLPSCGFINPERGFHGYVDLRDLDDDTLAGNAADGRALVYGQVLIPEYRDAPLDAVVLDEVAAGLDLVRAHGMKVVPRFHYSNDIGEPDATLARILEHIDQLTPLLQEHADVILLLQAGFIGAYGEWHSSENGLDAPGPRKQILDALLAALPADRAVGVRRPSFKEEAYGGPLAPDSAHDGSPLARVGHINDCFLASDDDYGTYQEPGEKDYAVADSAFVPVGGETCAVNPPRSDCPSALAELALLHWTHLNAAYHPDVLAGWAQQGCYAEVACRLGYRLAATQIRWDSAAAAGDAVPVTLELVNDGYAAPANPRPFVVVLDGPVRVEAAAAGFDLRVARPGEAVSVCVEVPLPGDAPPGMYRVGLRLADAAPSLADDPRQAIRLANDDGVAWSEGVNWFDATLTVE